MSEPARHLRVVHNFDADTGELTNCPHCREAQEEAEIWEREVVALKRQLKQALEDKDEKMRQDKNFPAAVGLIQEWKKVCEHPNSSEDDPKRLRLALGVIRRYKKRREVLTYVALQGRHLGYRDPDTGFRYDEFGRLYGSADEIEKRATQWFLHARRNGLDPLTGEKA